MIVVAVMRSGQYAWHKVAWLAQNLKSCWRLRCYKKPFLSLSYYKELTTFLVVERTKFRRRDFCYHNFIESNLNFGNKMSVFDNYFELTSVKHCRSQQKCFRNICIYISEKLFLLCIPFTSVSSFLSFPLTIVHPHNKTFI